MEVLVLVAIFITLPMFGYLLGKGSANGEMFTIKRENERLNAELHKLTDRDERGRFKGGK
jgi:multisubunit Na+/H+ antiporter MnhG subunit